MKNGSASAPMLNAIVILPDDDEALVLLVLLLALLLLLLLLVLVLVELPELLQPARTAIDAQASRATAPRAPADLVRR
jgi:hypothetical protein